MKLYTRLQISLVEFASSSRVVIDDLKSTNTVTTTIGTKWGALSVYGDIKHADVSKPTANSEDCHAIVHTSSITKYLDRVCVSQEENVSDTDIEV